MGKDISRRAFVQGSAAALATLALDPGLAAARIAGSRVYFTRDLSPNGLLRIYSELMQGRTLPGKVAVKLHSGEPGGTHYPAPALITDLVQTVHGTIVECNTAYPGKRADTAGHRKVLDDHGFAAIAAVDVMDAEGSVSLPCGDGTHIKQNHVGSHFLNYDSFLILSHFKGHAMGGFGGAIKNMSIGIASAPGTIWIHTAGVSREDFGLAFRTDQNAFLESMAEAAKSVSDRLGGNVAYINLMNHLSVDCDCDSTPAPPELADIGILASLDPVALDRACVDLVYAADSARSAALRQRIESRNGTHTLVHAERIGLGSQQYELVNC